MSIRRPLPEFLQPLAMVGICVGLAAATAGCGSSAPSRPASHRPLHSSTGPTRGELLGSVPLVRMDASEADSHLRRDGYQPRSAFSVKSFRLTYRTIDAEGAPTSATGVLFLPVSSQQALVPVEYMHGTLSAASEAPSVDDNGRSDEAMLFAAAGYAALAPDELGLGTVAGPHPYLQLSSETSSGVDLLRAADTFVRSQHRALERRVLVTGFSQGAQAAMGLSKSLAGGDDAPWTLRATAAVSGPYALAQAEIPAVLDRSLDQRDSAFYVAYLLTAWNRLYHLYDAPGEVFRPPYDRAVATLFDGRHTEMQVFRELPATTRRLLTPFGRSLLAHPRGTFATALKSNDASCSGWPADTPVHLYVSSADEQVAGANTDVCQRQLLRSGTGVTVVRLGPLPHFVSEREGLSHALAWTLRTEPPSGRP